MQAPGARRQCQERDSINGRLEEAFTDEAGPMVEVTG
jgi:hypothetical protein